MKAVIPAAGFGTRFLPLTKAQPKEMLPIVNKPTIQWVVEEAIDAGITDIAIITSKHKQAIESHFRPMKGLESTLAKTGKLRELEKIKEINKSANFEFIIQDEPKGLGHAILCAEKFVGDSPFVVLLGDTICIGNPNCTRGLIDIYNLNGKSVFAVEKVELEDTKRYGIVSGKEFERDILKIEYLVEKPNPEEAPSRLAILGRYVFNPDFFEYQRNITEGIGGEIQLTDAMQELAQKDELYSWTFPGKRYDIGTMKDWFQAHIQLSSKSEFSELLDEVIDNL